MRAIVTNIALHGFDLKETAKCTFCNNDPETLIHLFCTCPIVVCFWENVSSWISFRLQKNIVLTEVNMVFGVITTPKNDVLINFLLLCARFLIYRCKITEDKPNINQFFRMLNIIKNTEKYIAQKNNATDLFDQKWNVLL